MAEIKKGFILYSDQKELFEQLPDDKAGQLIKHIFKYVNLEKPITDDLIINLAFTPIKQQLKRDLIKYENKKDNLSKAGIEGNLKRWNLAAYNKYKAGKISLNEAVNIAKGRKASQGDKMPSPNVPFIADNVNVNVNVNDNVNDNDNVIVNVNDIKKELNNNLWIEQICMKKKLEIIDVKEYLNIFINDLELKDDLQKPIKELKKHFINWLNIQVKNVKKEIPKTIADKYAHLI